MNMYLNTVNPKIQTTFSYNPLKWGDPITIPESLKNYTGGMIVKTDTRRGFFTDYCKQVGAKAGPRSAQPFGPDTLFYGSITIVGTPSKAREDQFSTRIILKQNYPNPFSENTDITWQQPQPAHVVLKVYDLTGREVRTLVDGDQATGLHTVNFEAAMLPTGLYFYKLQADQIAETKKMIIK
jgi:hypothetical protein